ncbi:MAG: tetratricopeptide repeat protein [Thermoguttaceae bacterium]|nr:tetratricopeptide repeat protein [Thermoguttaceae bacterium]MDW8078412.1 tetratricopeptide repeat protein [Thermoguttaceae bacterium]
MKRQVNFRFLLIFLVVTLILAGGVHLLHGYQMRRNATLFLREAREAREAKDAGSALRFYQMYLDVRGQDVDVLAEYGLFLADIGHAGGAYGVLERVLRTDADRTEVRHRLVDVALQIGRYRDAKEHIEFLQRGQKQEDIELLEKLAQCEVGLGNYPQAEALFRKVIAKSPHRPETYVQLAELLDRRLGRPDEAQGVLDELVAKMPHSCTAWALRADYLRSRRRFQEALQSAEKALQLDRKNVPALMVAAECARELRDFDRALRFAQAAVELAPRLLQAYQVKANVEVAAGRTAEAISTIQAAAKLDPTNAQIRWHLANLYVEAKELQRAEELISALEKERFSPGLIEYIRGRLAVERGEWRLARQWLRRARGTLAAEAEHVKYVDFWLGVVEGQLGNRDEQLLAFRRAINADPFWVPARLGVASALAALGQTEAAIQESRHAFALGGNSVEAGLQLLSLLVLHNLVAPQTEARWAEAEQLALALRKAAADDWRPALLWVEILVGQRKLDEARQALQEAKEKWPQELEVWLAEAAFERRQRQFERVEEILANAETRLGDSARLRLARAHYLVEKLGDKAVEPVRALGENLPNWPDEERGQLLVGLGAFLMQLNEFGSARRYCLEAAKLLPHNLRARILLFDLALRAADQEALGQVVTEIEQIEGRGALWHYGRAVELVLRSVLGKEDRFGEARNLLMQAAALRPAWSRVPLLLAEIAERQNDPEQALGYYQRAFDLGEDNPRVIRRLLQLLYERQRYTEADRVLRRLEELRAPFTGELVRLASEISLRLQEFDRALELARQSAAASNDYQDRVWLGQVLAILGLRARAEGRTAQADAMIADAEREHRIALQLNPQAVDAWVALVRFYGVTGQAEKAQQALAEAQSTLVKGLGPLALAHCYTLLGRFEDAEKVYQEALAGDPTNPAVIRAAGEFYLLVGKTDLAAEQLEKLVGGSKEQGDTDIRWARRTLAFVLSRRGDYRSIARGLTVLEPNLHESVVTPADRRVQALLLAQHPQRKMREQAQRILESLIEKADVSQPADRYVLARLYLASGDVQKAVQQMRTLLAGRADNPEYVAFYVRLLLARDDLAEAEIWGRRLETIAPKSFETVDILAEIHARRGRIQEAIARLNDYLAEDESGQSQGTEPQGSQLHVRSGLVSASLMRLSLLLQEKGNPEGASALEREGESLFRKFAAEVPPDRSADAELALASFLARRGRTQEALDLLAKWGEQATPEFLPMVLAALVTGLGEEAKEWDVVRETVKKARAKNVGAVPLMLVEAELALLRRDYVEAERLYRELVAKEPENFIGLNNLAVTLAILRKSLDEAEQLAERALDSAGPRPEVLDTFAQVLMAKGQWREAMKVINEAIADSPLPILYLRQAQLLHASGQHGAAEKALREAEKLGLRVQALAPSDRDVYAQLKKDLQGSRAGSPSEPPRKERSPVSRVHKPALWTMLLVGGPHRGVCPRTLTIEV